MGKKSHHIKRNVLNSYVAKLLVNQNKLVKLINVYYSRGWNKMPRAGVNIDRIGHSCFPLGFVIALRSSEYVWRCILSSELHLGTDNMLARVALWSLLQLPGAHVAKGAKGTGVQLRSARDTQKVNSSDHV